MLYCQNGRLCAAQLADIMNLSLSTSTVPKQWKSASILPVAKVAAPHTPADYRPISNTSVMYVSVN